MRGEDGSPIASQGVMFDTTDQRRTQEELRETEERFRALVETIPAALYIELPDPDANSLYVSPQLETLAGVTPAEYVADPDLWVRLLHPDDRERADREYVRVLHLAASTAESEVEAALVLLLEQGAAPTLDAVRELVRLPGPAAVPELAAAPLALDVYDRLLGGEGGHG